MDYRALFGVVVRAFGLVLIWSGLYDAFFGLLLRSGLGHGSMWGAGEYALFAAFHVLAGLIVLKSARFIVGLAYDFRENPD
jgi:hypothetical protein